METLETRLICKTFVPDPKVIRYRVNEFLAGTKVCRTTSLHVNAMLISRTFVPDPKVTRYRVNAFLAGKKVCRTTSLHVNARLICKTFVPDPKVIRYRVNAVPAGTTSVITGLRVNLPYYGLPPSFDEASP